MKLKPWTVGLIVMLSLSAAYLLTQAQGTQTMSTSPHADALAWQGAADRKPARFLSIRVKAVRSEGSGLFGLRRSPSIAGALPDARIIDGVTLADGARSVTLRAPGGELPSGLAKGTRAALGLVDDQYVICLLLPPDAVADSDIAAWAATQRCG